MRPFWLVHLGVLASVAAAGPVCAEDGPLVRHGSVCLGPNLAKANHADWISRLAVKVGADGPFDFVGVPKLVVQGLPLDKAQRVQVLYDGKVIESWTLRFEARDGDAPRVMIWRAAGSWRMEPTAPDRCAFP
jgi:hypothetical protein